MLDTRRDPREQEDAGEAPGLLYRMLPLLNAIGRELRERGDRLKELESAMERHALARDKQGLRLAAAEAAESYRAVRHAREELVRLGVELIGSEPPTLRVSTRVGGSMQELLVRIGDPAGDDRSVSSAGHA